MIVGDGLILPAVADPELSSKLVEAMVATHYRRFFPTCCIQARAEVDVAVAVDGSFTLLEVKWQTRLRPGVLKQLRKYPNGVELAPVNGPRELDGVPVRPLALELLRLDGAGSRA